MTPVEQSERKALVERLRRLSPSLDMLACEDVLVAADLLSFDALETDWKDSGDDASAQIAWAWAILMRYGLSASDIILPIPEPELTTPLSKAAVGGVRTEPPDSRSGILVSVRPKEESVR